MPEKHIHPKSRSLMEVSRRLFDDVWNAERHAAAFELITEDSFSENEFGLRRSRGPLLLLDLLRLYKSCIPDLHFSIRGQRVAANEITTSWTARGRFSRRALGRARPNRTINLQGAIRSQLANDGRLRVLESSWDSATFTSSIKATRGDFVGALRRSASEIRVRTRPGQSRSLIVLFPTLSLPGWIGWRGFLDSFQTDRELLTFQYLANRWALDDLDRSVSYSVRQETRAIESCLINAHVETPFDLLAHSVGGCYAIDFTLRNPAAVRTLTLIEPVVPWVLYSTGAVDADVAEYIRGRLEHYRPGISESEYARFIRKTAAVNTKRDPRTSQYWPDVAIYRENMKFRSALFRHRNRLTQLKELDIPVLLVRGNRSDHFHHRTVEVLAKHMFNSRVVALKGGHAPHLGAGMSPFIRQFSQFLVQS